MSEADAATAAESTEDAEARGFVGDADPRDRDEYALTSGPESPSAAETQAEARVAEAQAHLDEIKANVQSRGAGAKEAHAEHKAARQARRGES